MMLKWLLPEKGPYELEIIELFSTEPLSLNPRSHRIPLLDVIQLPDDPPIIVNPLLRPFCEPRLQTFGNLTTFFFSTDM